MSIARIALAGLMMAVTLAATPARSTEVQRVVSPLGIEAWLIENPRIPVIAVDFSFEGGIELDPAGKEGRAHLLSVLLDEGAGDLDSATFQRRFPSPPRRTASTARSKRSATTRKKRSSFCALRSTSRASTPTPWRA